VYAAGAGRGWFALVVKAAGSGSPHPAAAPRF
jgi:hypothetical protein